MKTCVVTVADRIPDRSREPYYNYGAWLESLHRLGVEPTVLGIGELWRGLMTIPRRVRHWIKGGHCKTKYVIMSNCFDVLFLAHPDAVIERWGGGDEVIFNAEKDLFPRHDLRYAFPDPGTPWRYLNSGFYMGKTECVLAMLESMNMDDLADDHHAETPWHGSAQGQMVHPNDQGWFQFLYAARPVPMTLDSKCEVFQSFSNCTWDEFDLSQSGKIKNRVTGTHPLVLHCNGGAKDAMLPDLCRKFGFQP